jgi:hypothetical protein
MVNPVLDQERRRTPVERRWTSMVDVHDATGPAGQRLIRQFATNDSLV